MIQLYDLILNGIDPELVDRQTAIASIAELLEIDKAKIENIIDKGLKAVVKEGICQQDAQYYQKQILRYGGFSNYRPSEANTSKLELTPIEARKEDIVFICPACHYREKVESEAKLPVSCPRCKIIPSKYIKVEADKNERELIKRRILNNQKIQEQQAQELADHKAENERRRLLEEEIRKELGLPSLINSHLRVMGLGAIICLLGIGLGVGGFYFYVQSVESGFQKNNDVLKSGWNHAEQIDALRQIETLSQTTGLAETDAHQVSIADGLGGANPLVYESNPPPNSVNGGNPLVNSVNKGDSPVRSDGHAANASDVFLASSHLDVGSLLESMPADKEWDLFLAAEALRFAQLKQTAKASQMFNAISSDQIKINTFGSLSGYYIGHQNKPEVDSLLSISLDSSNSLPEVSERIDSLGHLAVVLWKIGERSKAKQVLESADKLIPTITEASEKAKALVSLSSHQAQMGQKNVADDNLRLANETIQRVAVQNKKLSAYIKLASGYAERGNKTIAMTILFKTFNSITLIKDESVQNKLIDEITEAFANTGYTDYALVILDKLAPNEKEKIFFNLGNALTYLGRPFDALKVYEKLQTPEYTSRANALLALVFRYRFDMEALSPGFQQKAMSSLELIADPQDQAIVRGEIARYLAHGGLVQEAGDLGRKGIANAQSLKPGRERDIAFAVLAANLVRAKQAALAVECADQIKDEELVAYSNKDIPYVSQFLGGK